MSHRNNCWRHQDGKKRKRVNGECWDMLSILIAFWFSCHSILPVLLIWCIPTWLTAVSCQQARAPPAQECHPQWRANSLNPIAQSFFNNRTGKNKGAKEGWGKVKNKINKHKYCILNISFRAVIKEEDLYWLSSLQMRQTLDNLCGKSSLWLWIVALAAGLVLSTRRFQSHLATVKRSLPSCWTHSWQEMQVVCLKAHCHSMSFSI